MAKTKLEDWDEVAANNLDMGGISLAENVMRAPAVNNEMREHMSQVSKWLGDDTLVAAATTDLGSVPGRKITITGNTGITSFGTIKAGTIKYLVFTGTPILTQNATSFILPSGANIQVVAGDTAIFVSEGSGNWRCIIYEGVSSAVASILSCGRLTLTSAVPITTADVTGAATVYFTPFKGNQIGLYIGTAWVMRVFTEKSIALSGGTASKPHDIFGYDNVGVLALELLAWTNDTTRATALALQDGIYVKTGDTTRRYLGTVYLDGSKQCEDSLARRMVWNVTNRIPRAMRVLEATATWSYGTATWRQARATTTNRLEFVSGLAEDSVHTDVVSTALTAAGEEVFVSIGLDSTTTPVAGVINSSMQTPQTNYRRFQTASFDGYPGLGRHTLTWLEYASVSSAATWYGAQTTYQSGISGSVQG